MTDQDRIASATILYVVGGHGYGKTFTGDYLAAMHDYSHIDGDGPLKNCGIPENKEMTTNMLDVGFKYVPEGEDGPEELWQPYYEEIVKQTIEAAKYSDKVVLSHATYRQGYREYVVEKLVEGGATKENITVLNLTIDPEVRLKGLYHRTKFQIEAGGMTMGDHMRTLGWEGGGEPTCSDYIENSKMNNPNWNSKGAFQELPDGYECGKIVDASGRDMTHLDGIDKALGLVGKRNDKTLTFEEIRDKVKPIDAQRDLDMDDISMREVVKIFKRFAGKGDDSDTNNDDDDDANETDDNDAVDKEDPEKH